MIIFLIVVILFIIVFLQGCRNPKHPVPEPPEPNPVEETWEDYYPEGAIIPTRADYGKWRPRNFNSNDWSNYESVIQGLFRQTGRDVFDDIALSRILMTKLLDGRYLFKWTSDMEIWGQADHWASPDEFLYCRKDVQGSCDPNGLYRDDCLEENTEILVKDGVKKIKDLKVGDMVLSYNYDLEKYEYKPVTKVWDKGILDGYNIRLKNGHSVIATGEHKLFCRTSERYPERYKVRKIKDINLDRWYERQLHCVHKLPEGTTDIDKNLAYLIGIYIAEGWSILPKGRNTRRVYIAQDNLDIRAKIEKVLNALDIPFSKSKRDTQSYYELLRGSEKYKDILISLGTNSFDKKLPDDVLEWNNSSLKALIEGLLDGDGTYHSDEYKNNLLWTFSTSSEAVVKAFNIIVRKVYGSIYYYKQLNHQGVGKQPIWRLDFNTNSLYNKREIYKGIGTVGIRGRELEVVKDKHFYDIEVRDNHNFVLAESGLISHNCDGFAGLNCDILYRMMEYPLVWWVSIYWRRQSGGVWRSFGHAITVYKREWHSPYRVFCNQSWVASVNGKKTIEDIVQMYVPTRALPDNYKLVQVKARHPITGKLLWYVNSGDW